MSTILFNEIVFGPIHSRRLGSSLGVNLLPRYGKWCNFDCLYCECGFNADGKSDKSLPKAADVKAALEDKLSTIHKEGGNIDTITFSGNGEPTMHPDFPAIIDYALELRNRFFPNAKVSVLSNASRIGVPEVADALLKVDNAILKIDSAFEETTMQIDRPQFHYSLENLKKGLNPFRGKFVLQTMFLRGEYNGAVVDNTTEREVSAWQKLAEEIEPREIMVYTIDRETPAHNLEKVSVAQMEEFTAPLVKKGYKVSVSG